MGTSLVLTQKTFSLHGQVWVHAADGTLLFEGSRPRLFGRTIQLRDTHASVCLTLEPQPWKPDPTWLISGQLGSFSIKRKKKSFERSYWIEQGPFDGVIIEGGFYDQAFRIRHGENIIAEADESRFSMKAKHALQLLNDSPETRLLASAAGIIVIKEKQESRQSGS